MEAVAVQNSFGQSGPPEALMEKYGLNAAGIIGAVRKVLERKA